MAVEVKNPHSVLAALKKRPRDVVEVRCVRIEDVVVPVRRQPVAVGFVVAMICGDSVSAVQDCKEVRQQIDEHQRQGRGGPAQRIAKRPPR